MKGGRSVLIFQLRSGSFNSGGIHPLSNAVKIDFQSQIATLSTHPHMPRGMRVLDKTIIYQTTYFNILKTL